MVKDLRTAEETSDTTRVLDGGLEPFIQAYLRSQVGQAAVEAQAEEAGT
jgi:peptide chain release factor 2